MSQFQKNQWMSLIFVFFTFSLLGCQAPQKVIALQKETAPSDEILLVPTATTNKMVFPTATKNPGTCNVENVVFPAPQELENYIGWQYVSNEQAFDYPDGFGTLLQINGQDYGFDAYELDDHSYILVLQKLLCHKGTHPVWEVIDVLRTRPVQQNEHADLGTACKKDGQWSSDYLFIFMDKTNNGIVFLAWSINKDKKIKESTTEGLWCIIDGES